jgi:hypothetical protein
MKPRPRDYIFHGIIVGIALYFTARTIDEFDSVQPALLAFFWFGIGATAYKYWGRHD